MAVKTIEERVARIEERQEAMEIAIRAVLFGDWSRAQDEGRDGLASGGETSLAFDEIALQKAQKSGDASARRERVIARAAWLLNVEGGEDGPSGT